MTFFPLSLKALAKLRSRRLPGCGRRQGEAPLPPPGPHDPDDDFEDRRHRHADRETATALATILIAVEQNRGSTCADTAWLDPLLPLSLASQKLAGGLFRFGRYLR